MQSPIKNPLSYFQRASFLTGAQHIDSMPPDHGFEAAFVGRSNSGKSSSINAIVGRRALARTSKTPGRTQQINFFDLGEERRLVDLPGYGYAEVPDRLRREWRPLIEGYLEERRSLCGLILTADCRRAVDDLELMIIDWCRPRRMPVHILLTKSDKLSRGAGHKALHAWRRGLPPGDANVSAQLFSSLDKQGVDEARDKVLAWLNFGQKKAPV
ncbi:MAG: YihA family ribosome biogenesis GTP-binding protein [Gammaproteobacteria bacterium]|nr:YihA family ribosome biogenesis GTP-binding protein [Gammaproteobacteria bacterium]